MSVCARIPLEISYRNLYCNKHGNALYHERTIKSADLCDIGRATLEGLKARYRGGAKARDREPFTNYATSRSRQETSQSIAELCFLHLTGDVWVNHLHLSSVSRRSWSEA